jgi:hypothetical protein
MNRKLALLAAIVITVAIFFSGITNTVLSPKEAAAGETFREVGSMPAPYRSGREHALVKQVIVNYVYN